MAAPYPNSAVEDDENGIEDSSRLFTTPARDLLGGAAKGLRSFFRYKRRIQFFALVGRNVTTDAQTIDPLFNANRQVPVSEFNPTASFVGTGALVGGTGTWPGTVGDVKWVVVVNAADGSEAAIPSTAISGVDRLYEVLQIVSGYIAIGVATRVHQIAVSGMLTFGQATVDSLREYLVPTGVTLTDTEEGKIVVPRAPGLVQLNDNGTITTSDSSPLPIYVEEAGTIATTTTNRVATDRAMIAALVRRVA